MKVLFVTRKYPPAKGGMEAYSYNLITHYTGEKKSIVLGKKQTHLIWFFPYTFFYAFFHAKKYDVIELGDMLMSAVGWVAKKRNKNIKVVATVHGLDITYSKKIYQKYLKMFSYGFDMYVPNSSYTLEVAESRGYGPLICVPPATLNENNTIFPPKDKDKFCKKYEISPDSFVIATTGRLVKRKGVEWFIRNGLANYENKQLVYLVVGVGPMEEEIKAAIQETGEKRVKMLGKISDEDLLELYTNIDVFLMPNILVENDVEGFGMVATEACAASTLVVAAEIQGIKDAIKNNTNGILYEPGNKDALINILDDVYNNPDKYDSIRNNTRSYVLSKYTGNAVAKSYSEIFENLFA